MLSSFEHDFFITSGPGFFFVDQTGEELERQGMGATEEQKMAGTINLLMTQNDVFEEMFFR